MCNFDKLNDDTKLLIHQFLKKGANTLGGTNFLLNLIEKMKEHKPNPLIYKNRYIRSNEATIEWNKTVFQDKFELLEQIIHTHKGEFDLNTNILKDANTKKGKKILNMVKTLAPIEFIITPTQNPQEDPLSFKIFDTTTGDLATLNPIFVAIFFCSIEFIKKGLKYTLQ